jgi:Methyltransferase domain
VEFRDREQARQANRIVRRLIRFPADGRAALRKQAKRPVHRRIRLTAGVAAAAATVAFYTDGNRAFPTVTLPAGAERWCTAGMDVARFLRELPGLFDRFPDSEHPKDRRFRDIVEGMPALAEENNLALLNLAASALGEGECYLEVGAYLGASLIAAARDNDEHEFVAIDRFGFGPLELPDRGRPHLPRSTRALLDQNLARFDTRRATILEGDAFSLVEQGALGSRRVGVYYYDADHSYEAELAGLRLGEPWLADHAVLIADNSDDQTVARALADYLEGQPLARLVLDLPGKDRGHPQWWGGVQVIEWEAAPA